MADCTVSDVLTDAMSLLGDADGEITQELVSDFNTAYSELNGCLLKINAQEIQRELYFTLPANTNVVFASQLGVSDFGEPQQIWERGSVSTANITSIVDGTPITVNVDVMPSPVDGRVELNSVPNVPAWVNRDWFITKTGATQFTLNGSISTGVGGTLASSGKVMWSPEQWLPMKQPDFLPATTSSPAPDVLGSWKWEDNILYFPQGANLPRQLWIQYLANGTPPASGVIGIANGRELKFLSHATAAHFAPKRQMVMGPQLQAIAYGPSGEPDATGGLLRQLIKPIELQQQQMPRQMGRYRRRRIWPAIG